MCIFGTFEMISMAFKIMILDIYILRENFYLETNIKYKLFFYSGRGVFNLEPFNIFWFYNGNYLKMVKGTFKNYVDNQGGRALEGG